jgi:hypothetical protein
MVLLAGSAAAQNAASDNVFGFTEQEIQEEQAKTPEERRTELYGQLVQQLQAQTEELWGAQVGHPIDPNILDKDGLAELLERLLKEELGKPEVQGSMQVMKFFEMIPEDLDFEAMVQGLMEGQVGGLYNPADKSLYVVSSFDPSGFIGKMILSHEIGHAIQDSKVDLVPWFEQEKNLDRQKAKQAVLEGDATVLMIDWATRNLNAMSLVGMLGQLESQFAQQFEGLEEAPQVIVQDLIFSYMGGAQFCQTVQIQHPKDWRRRVFTDPPVSTEQVLHPEKYLGNSRDLPIDVTFAQPAEDSGWREVYRNVFGEWNTRLFLTPPDAFPEINLSNLDPVVKEPISKQAAAGWGGDLMALYEKENGEQLLVWRTAWDSEQDGQEFLEGLKRRLSKFNVFANGRWGDRVVIGNNRHAAFRQLGREVQFVMAENDEALKDGIRLITGK